MADIKFTKKSLRDQQQKLHQLKTYLPTLQLKKKLLQFEISQTNMIIDELFKKYQKSLYEVDLFSDLLNRSDSTVDTYAAIEHVMKSYENIAGIEVPIFKDVQFKRSSYTLFDTPLWQDAALSELRTLIKIKQHMNVEEEKRRSLMKELNEVSIRVNLFEKVLIPRTNKNIKKINIFLGDQELAAVAQAKIAKLKILAK